MTEREPEPEALCGRFWLADAEEQKVSGRLTLGSEGPRLELDGTLTPGMRLKSVATAEDGSTLSTYVPVLEEDELLTVHGEVESGVGIEPVTLVDGITSSRTYNPLSPGAGRQRLQGLYAFRGGHVAGKDELFTQVRVRLHHLDEWASLGGFGQEFDQDKASIIFEQPEVPPVPLRKGGRLDLQQVLACFSDVSGGGLTRTVWLRAVNLPPTRWRELDRGLITPLSTLFTLAVDADCPPVQVEVATGPDSGWLSIHSSGLRPPPDRARPCGPDAAAPGCARAARGRGLVGPRRDPRPAAARCRRRRGRPPTDGRDWSSRPDHRGGRPRPPAVARLEPAHGRGSSRSA